MQKKLETMSGTPEEVWKRIVDKGRVDKSSPPRWRKREKRTRKTNEKGPTTQLAINTPTPNNKLDEFGGEQMAKYVNIQTNEIRDELPDEPQIGENDEDN